MTRRALVRLGTAGVASLYAPAWASETRPPAAPAPKPPPAATTPAPAPPRAPTLAQDRSVIGLYGVNGISGVALAGFDPVSYFVAGAQGPEGGRPGLEWRYAGVDWCFANAGNREAFRRDTAVYLPRCGGFDPLGIVAGRLVAVDPLVFALVAGRLYLFRDAERRAGADVGVLAEAERRYPALVAAPE